MGVICSTSSVFVYNVSYSSVAKDHGRVDCSPGSTEPALTMSHNVDPKHRTGQLMLPAAVSTGRRIKGDLTRLLDCRWSLEVPRF